MRLVKLVPLLLLLVAAVGPALAAAPFQPADKLFTATFPGAPSRQEDSVPSKAGPAYKRVAYAVETPSHMLMVGVIYIGDGPALNAAEQKAMLAGTVDSMALGMQGFVPAAGDGLAPVTVSGHAGRQIKGIAGGTGFNARVFVTGKNLLLVQGLYDAKNPVAKAATEAFVASFRISD
jgi:hypothetical protein